MENASKALIIAGGVLIAILIISLGVYLFNSASTFSNNYSDKLSDDELNKLNNRFLIYARDLTPQEMVTVVNLIAENNKKNANIPENQIKLVIDNTTIDTNKTSQDWKTVIMEQTGVDNEPKYQFLQVNYHETSGRISQMAWRSIGSSIPIGEQIKTTCYHTWGEWTYVDDLNHKRTCRKCQQEQVQMHTWENYTENGNNHKKTCPICDSIKEEAHQYTAYKDNNNGTHSRNCQKCTKVETNPHDWNRFIAVNDEKDEKSCKLCSAKEQGNHTWGEWSVKTSGTCVTDEVQERICTKCNQKQEKTIPAPNVHEWKVATCTTPRTCSRCGETSGNALGHIWKEATCTTVKTCTRCGTTSGNALGHSWKGATCTAPQICSRCGATSGSALGHAMGSWQTTKAATCTKSGTKMRSCTRCGHTETQSIGSSGHNWRYDAYRNKGFKALHEVWTIRSSFLLKKYDKIKN